MDSKMVVLSTTNKMFNTSLYDSLTHESLVSTSCLHTVESQTQPEALMLQYDAHTGSPFQLHIVSLSMGVHVCSGELAESESCQCPGNIWEGVGVLSGHSQLRDLQQPVRRCSCLLACIVSNLCTIYGRLKE